MTYTRERTHLVGNIRLYYIPINVFLKSIIDPYQYKRVKQRPLNKDH